MTGRRIVVGEKSACQGNHIEGREDLPAREEIGGVMGGDAREQTIDDAKLEVCSKGLLSCWVKSGACVIFEKTDRVG